MDYENFKEGQTVWWLHYTGGGYDGDPIYINRLELRHGIYKNNYVEDDDCNSYKVHGINEFFPTRDEALMALFQQVNKYESDK